jgi:hypothetical protein
MQGSKVSRTVFGANKGCIVGAIKRKPTSLNTHLMRGASKSGERSPRPADY